MAGEAELLSPLYEDGVREGQEAISKGEESVCVGMCVREGGMAMTVSESECQKERRIASSTM